MKNHSQLEVYLQDHYAGAVGAIELLDHLSKTHEKEPFGSFLRILLTDIRIDHQTLERLMNDLSIEESKIRDGGAWMAEKFGRVKLGFPGGDRDELRLFQAMETILI